MPLNKPLDKVQDTDDVIKCMAVFADSKALCFRARDIPSYVEANMKMITYPHQEATPWEPVKFVKKDKRGVRCSVLRFDTEVGAKAAVTNCVIGFKCEIGSKVQLNRSILMDGVTVGENCKIQRCAIASGVKIGKDCVLSDCNVAPGVVIEAGAKRAGEFVTATDDEEDS